MPKPREGSPDKADGRPAFSRPPGAKANGGDSGDVSPKRRRSPVKENGGDSENVSPKRRRSPLKENGGDSGDVSPKRRRSPEKAKQSPAPSPEKESKRTSRDSSGRRKSRSPEKGARTPTDRAKHNSTLSLAPTQPSTHVLSVDSLAKLNQINDKHADKEAARKEKEKQYKDVGKGKVAANVIEKKSRHVSSGELEKGVKRKEGVPRKRRNYAASAVGSAREYIRRRGGTGGDDKRSLRKKRIILLIVVIIILLIIIIPIAAVYGSKGRSHGKSSSNPTSNAGGPANTELNGMSENDIPQAARGGVLDPFTWYDTKDFNVTFTNDTVGGLPLMGLNKTWDDSKAANPNVPPLNQIWTYGQMPIRGVNIGGWLSIEPFITPSMFNKYSASDHVVDEYTLTQKLGPAAAAQMLEKHYATFVTEQTFIDIANAGIDHVRIPYPYWAVTTYDGDPYVPKIAWRYLLRGIEWARKCGLRVNLDLHALPGSQNGWNHSGRWGVLGWLNGTDGTLNAQRALDVHNQLSQFFAQERYATVVTIYGLANEPRMMSLPIQPVLDWNTQAVQLIRRNGVKQYLVFGDGFLGLDMWHGMFKNVDPGLVLDTHQYVIFNTAQLAFTHQNKINMACAGWTGLLTQAQSPATG